MIKLALAALLSMLASSASAYNLAKAMAGKPEAQFESSRPLYEVERCIVMLDLPSQPSVYRTPDRPDESLIHFGQTTPMAIHLLQRNGKIAVVVWNGSKWAKRVADCAAGTTQ